jgi:hypothetical protein
LSNVAILVDNNDHCFYFRGEDDQLNLKAQNLIERTTDISPSESRDRIKSAIEKRYTLPV